MATEQELSDFLKSVEKRAFKRTVYAVRDDDAALDIVQDAMIRLAEKYADRPLAELPLIFARILSNATMDWFRRQKVRQAAVQHVYELDAAGDDPINWTLATGEPADPATLSDLVFAWRTCRAVKSNAIVVARDGATVGVGMGQVNRVDAARLAVERAGAERARGAVAASDAFFPFPDGLETLTAAGVKAIVHPGGSVRDDEVTNAAAQAGITLYLTGARHFAH